ncbi:hypothetical protein LY76DRAFT_647974 [Colletotrichum caudatum]|nr:hypothetical protein LY76DRAFT_647974 [Colletotrichum caudatum]
MFSKATIAITGLLALAEAVKVTEPAKGDDWDLSKTNEITWQTVSSDPSSFEIVIVNQASYPGVSQTIAKVNAADGKYELKDLKLAPGGSYRINLVSTDPLNSGILAQSEEFSLTGSDDSSSSAPASASATASVSASGSASATGSSSSSGPTATGSVTQTASGLTTVTTGSATATVSGASSSGAATGTASGTAASGSSTAAPNSASGIKSTFAILGSFAVAAYMLF